MDQDRQDVEEVIRAFGECWNQHDMEAFAQLFADDAEFVSVVGLWWKGRDDIKRAHLATHARMFKHSHLVITDIAVRFVAPDVAVVRSPWELTGHIGPYGELLPKRKGILTNLLVRNGDRWQIVDSQNGMIRHLLMETPPPGFGSVPMHSASG
jgi:uncharacterized protein (TIGR02246 family)